MLLNQSVINRIKLAFLIMLFASSTCLYAAPQKIKLAYPLTANYPYTTGYGDKINWEKPGVALDVIKLVEKELDIEISISRIPWKRGLLQLEQGNIDGLFSASFKIERFQYGVYPMKDEQIDRDRKFYDLCYCLYKMKDSPLIWDGKTLKNQSRPVGTMRGYSIINILKENEIDFVENDNELSNFKMLTLGRLDAVATYSDAGDALLNQYQDEFKDVVKMEHYFEAKPYYLMFSHQFVKDNQEVADKIWDAIERVRKSEKFFKLFNKYSVTEP